MIQQIARTTFPLFRSDNNNNDRDRSDGFLVNRCLSFRKKNSTLLFRKNNKNKKAEDDNQIHKPKQTTSSRSDTNTVTQLTPSPNYVTRPIISDRVQRQREQETGSSSIPTVPELKSTPPKLFSNSSNSSIRRRRQRLTSIAYSSRRSSSSSLSASHEVLLRRRSSSSSSRQQSITDDGNDDGDFNQIEPLLDPNTHTQDQEQQVEVEDEDNEDFLVVKDATSLLFPPPPIEYVEIPEDFTHATALQDNKSNNNTKSNSSTSVNLLALNRPPKRLSDWDEQTIESNSEELVQLKTHTNNRGVVSSIASLSSAAKKVAVRNALTDRRQRRIRSILQVSQHSNSPQRRMASSALVDKTSSENNEEHEDEEQGLLRSPRRVVKWNMVQQPPRSPQPQPRVVNWNMVQQPPSPQQQQQHQALEQQSQQPRVVKWNMIR